MLKCHDIPIPEQVQSCNDLHIPLGPVLKGEKAEGGYRFRAYINDVCVGITDVIDPNDMYAGMMLNFHPISNENITGSI